MAAMFGLFIFCVLFCFSLGVRINFTSCHQPEWSCLSASTEIIYTCSHVTSNDFIVYLKDYYNENTISVVIQNCRDVRVVLDCPILQRPSRLQHFKIKDCDRLEFITLSSSSLVQTPPEFTIENVREVVSFPRNIFKSPTSNTELKCMGTAFYKKIRIVNSKINLINTKAIHNVTQINTLEFENVTINDIKTQGIEILTNSNKSMFTVANSKIENMDSKAITVQSSMVKLINNDVGNIITNAINITAENLVIQGNIFKEITANGIATYSIKTDISDNNIKILRANGLASIKCAKKSNNKEMKFRKNKIEKVEPLSLYFDYGSCKSNTLVMFSENIIDCKCRSISHLNTNNDLNDIILKLSNNNTCLLAACVLPIEIVKLLIESDMCDLELAPQIMCLLYNDKHSNNSEITTDEDVTEPAPTFYLIRQANTLQDAGAAMTAIDKDDLLRDSNLNITNRTTVKVVFDSSRDFVETLRSTSRTAKGTVNKSTPKEEFINRCVGGQCRNTVLHDKQKALEFYKYVYAQLRTPRPDVTNGKN